MATAPVLEPLFKHRKERGIDVHDDEGDPEDTGQIRYLGHEGELVLAGAEVVREHFGPELLQRGPDHRGNPGHAPAGIAGDQPRGPRPGGDQDAVGRGQQQQTEGGERPGHPRELLEHLDGPVETADVHDDAGEPADAEGPAGALVPDRPQDRHEADPFEVELVKAGVAQKYEHAARYRGNPGQCCCNGIVGCHALSLVWLSVGNKHNSSCPMTAGKRLGALICSCLLTFNLPNTT